MTQLTKEEIEMIEREATELSEHNSHTQRDSWMVYDTCKITATKYLLQLKSERERAGKLMEALGKWKQAHKNFDTGYKNIDGKTTRVDISILSMECNSSDRNLLTAINEYNNKP